MQLMAMAFEGIWNQASRFQVNLNQYCNGTSQKSLEIKYLSYFFKFNEIVDSKTPTSFEAPKDALFEFTIGVRWEGRSEWRHHFEDSISGKHFVVVVVHWAGNQPFQSSHHRFDQRLHNHKFDWTSCWTREKRHVAINRSVCVGNVLLPNSKIL